MEAKFKMSLVLLIAMASILQVSSKKIETITKQVNEVEVAKKIASQYPRVEWDKMKSSYEPNGVKHSAKMLALITAIHRELKPVMAVVRRERRPRLFDSELDLVPPVRRNEPKYKLM